MTHTDDTNGTERRRTDSENNGNGNGIAEGDLDRGLWCKSCGAHLVGDGGGFPKDELCVAHIRTEHDGDYNSHPGFTTERDEALEGTGKKYTSRTVTITDIIAEIGAENPDEVDLLDAGITDEGDLQVILRRGEP